METAPKKFQDGLENTFKKMQSIQTDYLTRKTNAESELLNKFWNYCKQRSGLESEYAKNLHRLSQQFSVNVNLCNDLGFSNRSLYNAWNSYLDDTTKISRQHSNLSKFYEERIMENLKNFTSKPETSKRCFDKLTKLHQEILLSVKDVEKHRRDYFIAMKTLEGIKKKLKTEKVPKRKNVTSQSKNDLDSSQLKEQQSVVERQLCITRNLYMIQLKKLSVHYERFITIDFPHIVTELEENVCSQVQDILSTSVCVEVGDYENIVRILQAMSKEIGQILSPEEHRQNFYACDHALVYPVTIQFEPCLSDTVRKLQSFDSTDNTLESESRTCYSTLVRSQKQIEGLKKKLELLKNCTNENLLPQIAVSSRKVSNTKRTSNPSIMSSNTTKVLSEQIRDLEDNLRKAETNKAISEAIFNELRQAGVVHEELLTVAANDGSSVLSSGSGESSRVSINSSELYLYGDGGKEWKPKKCRCLYTYEARRNDEISFEKDDYVTVLQNPEGKEWFEVQNNRGETGLAPYNYIELDGIVKPSSSGSNDSAAVSSEDVPSEPEFWCEAFLDYSAECDDELSFNDGDLIAVISSMPNGIDDGWWKGIRLEANEEGTFPSMMVVKLSSEEAQRKLGPRFR